MIIVNSKWEPLRSKSSVSYGHYKGQTLLTKLHCMKLALQEIKFIFPICLYITPSIQSALTLTYGVPVRERYGSTLLPATREQHDQNCTQSH